jgi:DNA-damage-inducible protein J
MAANTVVRARIDEQTKEEAAIVLAAMGLTLSDAFRIMLTRIAREKALPFEPLVPNAETLEAMKEARRGALPSFASVDALMADLNEADWAHQCLQAWLQTGESDAPAPRDIESLLPQVLGLLVADIPLPERNHDHPLAGQWKDYRDCHVKPDLVLIYRKPDHEVLQLVRIGSHSDLGF